MSAARIRKAAKVLRDAVEGATKGPWEAGKNGSIYGADYGEVIVNGPVDCMAYCYGGSSTFEGDNLEVDTAYIALMAPPVALALADWLDNVANVTLRWSERPGAGPIEPKFHALTLANTILGDRA